MNQNNNTERNLKSLLEGDQLLFTIAQCQEILQLSRSTLHKLIVSQQLGAVHVGRSVRIPASALRAFIETLPEVRL